ncbi:2-amino-5-chloromuconate deaminase CnbZ [Roseococcus sp. YIM B11640]|uniref:2-amino-5-chloromuconate deaminase CnbZ n=1 Tax=Roseococcus sp. YIM B11640 TaxID=3133973 RepID=UPI003C7A519D
MTATLPAASGGFRFVPGVYQYSAGVAAEPGFRIERVRFADPLSMAEGFARIAAALEAAGRPKAAFCACELRSPAPFTEDGFAAFNREYGAVLTEWGIFLDGKNPVARSNVCPEIAPPATPSFHAFSYTVPDANAAPSFVVAGSGESAEGKSSYREHTVALGDLSPAGMLKKGQYVLGEMERRMQALGFAWKDTTGVQVYTVHDLYPFLGSEIVKRGAARHGLTWQFCRPPVRDLEYEMDCRGVAIERVLPAA